MPEATEVMGMLRPCLNHHAARASASLADDVWQGWKVWQQVESFKRLHNFKRPNL